MMAAVMTTVAGAVAAVAAAAAAAAVAAVMTAVSVAIILRCGRSNPLTTDLPADGATGAAAASATTASLQRSRHQRHADLPASAHVWLSRDRAVAAGAKFSHSLFSLSSLALSHSRTSYSFVHFPHHISLKLVLLAEKS